MKFIYSLSWFFIIFAISTKSFAEDYVILCYRDSWLHLNEGQDVSLQLCTHLIFSSLSISENGEIVISDDWPDIQLGAIVDVIGGLKEKNNELKIMASVGRTNQGYIDLSKMAADSQLRENFVKSVVQFMEEWKLDGLDLDWEYPAFGEGSNLEDRQNFNKLTKELYKELKPIGFLLTTVVTGVAAALTDLSNDAKSLSEYLDYINIKAYDLHTFADGKTGFSAPLYESSSNSNVELTVKSILNGWIKNGADPKKLVLGLPFYGQSYTLANPSNHGVGAPTVGPGYQGEFTQTPGILSYLEICKRLNNGWTREWDDTQKVPYAFKGNQWVSYEDVKSLSLKTDSVLKALDLAGAMVWSIEDDDFQNICGGGEYPLLTAVHKHIRE